MKKDLSKTVFTYLVSHGFDYAIARELSTRRLKVGLWHMNNIKKEKQHD